MQDHPADQLHVVVPHVQGTPAALAHHGEGLGQQVVKGFTVGEPLLEHLRPGAQVRVGQGLQVGFEVVDAGRDGPQTFELSLILGAKDLAEEGIDHAWKPLTTRIASSGRALRRKGIPTILPRLARSVTPTARRGATQPPKGTSTTLVRWSTVAIEG